MKVVYKYPFEIATRVNITLPAGAKVLTAQVQRGVPCLWALVDPGAPREIRSFRVLGTGFDVDDRDLGAYVGTIQLQGGDFVWHVFEAATPQGG